MFNHSYASLACNGEARNIAGGEEAFVSKTHHVIPVVFLHGMFGAPENWRASMNALAPIADVHAPLLPVFHTPDRRDPVEFLVRLVRDSMREKGIERAVLVGNSLGGHVAVRLALEEPACVSGLVLSGSSGLFERGLEKNVPRHPSREWLRRKAEQVFFDPTLVTEAMVDEIAAVVSNRRSALQLLRVGQSAKRDNLATVLPRVAAPSLLIWGENDLITPLTTAWQFHELLPNSRLETIPRCGHAPMLEHPERFNELLVEFVCELSHSRKVLPIAQCAEDEQPEAHAGENHQVTGEVRKLAAA